MTFGCAGCPYATLPPGDLDGRNTVLQHNVVHRLIELEICDPAPMCQGPGGAAIMMAMALEEAGQLLAGLP